MTLDNHRVLSLTKDLKQVIVSDEVEARELRPLLFQVAIQSLLALVQLAHNRFKRLFDSRHIAQTHYFWVSTYSQSDGSELFINSNESSLLLGQSSPHENGLQVHPLALNHVKFGQVIINSSQFFLNLLNLVSKAREVTRLLERQNQTLVITDLSYHLLPLLNERGSSAIGLMLSKNKFSILAPDSQFINGFSDRYFSQSLLTQLFYLLSSGHHHLHSFHQVSELKSLNSGFFRKLQD